MEIALYWDVTEPAMMRSFLERDEPSIRKWRQETYEPMVELQEVTKYTSRVKPEHIHMLKMALELDREAGLRLAVAFYRQIFAIQQTVEVTFIDGKAIHGFDNMDGMLYYTRVAIGHFDLEDSKLLVPRGLLHSVSIDKIIGSTAHEIWHAHQYDVMVRWLRQSGGLLDLEQTDPKDQRLKGALYALGYEGYIAPTPADVEAYWKQRIEAEAEMVHKEILRLV